MGKLVKFAEKLGMDMASLLLLLILTFAALAYLANKFSGNAVGNIAAWAEAHAQPHQ